MVTNNFILQPEEAIAMRASSAVRRVTGLVNAASKYLIVLVNAFTKV